MPRIIARRQWSIVERAGVKPQKPWKIHAVIDIQFLHL